MTDKATTQPENFTPPAPLETAVLFLVFNRPDTTAQVFEAIRKAKPPRIYVAADGPRPDRADETEKVAKVREIATAVDWACEVKTLFRKKNLGCKHAVGGAITWFFNQEDQGIILEDDVLPSRDFFYFCEDGLKKWKNDQSVGGIGGFVAVKQGVPFLSMHGSVWGWATWKRAWDLYDPTLTNFQFDELAHLAKMGSIFLVAEKLNISQSISVSNVDTWDYFWLFSRIRNKLFMVLPGSPLTTNIGFAANCGTHIKGKKPESLKRCETMTIEHADIDHKKVLRKTKSIIKSDYKRFWSRNGFISLVIVSISLINSPLLMLKLTIKHLISITRDDNTEVGVK